MLLENYVVYAIGGLFLLAGIGRAFQMARGFKARAYRNRAYWMAALMIALSLGNVVNAYPTPALSSSATFFDQVVSSVGAASFAGALLVALLFVDQNLRVLSEVDFFHRDTLRWSKFRRAAIVFQVIGSIEIIALTVSNLDSSSPLYNLVIGTYFPIVGVTLGYASVALLVAARRTPDRPTKRFSLLLGISLAFGVVASTIWLPLSFVTFPELENFVSNIPAVVSYAVLYRATLSMSPLGRVQKTET